MKLEDYQSIRCQIVAHLHSAAKGNPTKMLEWLQALSLLDQQAAALKAAKPKASKSPKPASSK